MQLTEQAQRALSAMIDRLKPYLDENGYVPGLIWAFDRSERMNDPGPILASFTSEMIEKGYFSGQVKCGDILLYVGFPPNLWDRYKDGVIDVIDENINFIQDYDKR